MKCSKRYKKLFGFLKVKDKHNLIISNAFYTLEDRNVVELIRTCKDCSFKDVLTLDRETVFELLERYPNAFGDVLRDYLKSWMS